MAAVAFDSLDYAHQLEAAGMPRKQAEVVAKGLTTMFIHNFESLVTKDYLDTRFSEQSVRMELLASGMDAKLEALSGAMDARFGAMGARFEAMDARFEAMGAKFEAMDGRIESLSNSMDAKLESLSSSMDTKLESLSSNMDAKIGLLSAKIDGKLGKLYVMFGVIMVGLALPIIQTLITWFA